MIEWAPLIIMGPLMIVGLAIVLYDRANGRG